MESTASSPPIPSQRLYGTSKHATLGLLNIRTTPFTHGGHEDRLCPGIINIPIPLASRRPVFARDEPDQPKNVIEALWQATTRIERPSRQSPEINPTLQAISRTSFNSANESGFLSIRQGFQRMASGRLLEWLCDRLVLRLSCLYTLSGRQICSVMQSMREFPGAIILAKQLVVLLED